MLREDDNKTFVGNILRLSRQERKQMKGPIYIPYSLERYNTFTDGKG